MEHGEEMKHVADPKYRHWAACHTMGSLKPSQIDHDNCANCGGGYSEIMNNENACPFQFVVDGLALVKRLSTSDPHECESMPKDSQVINLDDHNCWVVHRVRDRNLSDDYIVDILYCPWCGDQLGEAE